MDNAKSKHRRGIDANQSEPGVTQVMAKRVFLADSKQIAVPHVGSYLIDCPPR
jgi:hypothetical protein